MFTFFSPLFSFTRKSRRPRPGARLRPEILEDRTVPANFFVTDLTDNGPLSTGTGSGDRGDLRYCVLNASQGGTFDTIEFQQAGIVTLQGTLPVIAQFLLQPALGVGSVTITRDAAAGDFSLFNIFDDSTVTMRNLTLTGGKSDSGGAIFNNGRLTLDHVDLIDNEATSTSLNGGGGGAIFNRAILNAVNCNFSTNSSEGGGGAITSIGTATIAGSTFSSNSAPFGGALYVAGQTSVQSVSFFSNTAFTPGSEVDGRGGAILLSSGNLDVSGSTFERNISFVGGGLMLEQGTAILTNTTLSDNRALNDGGGIATGNAMLRLVNSTITLNRADVDDNTFGVGGGVAVVGSFAPFFKNTIVAGNFTGQTNKPDDVTGVLNPTSQNNLFGLGGSGGLMQGVNGNLVNVTNVGLVPLGDYGGGIRTHVLAPGSPAINAGTTGADVPTRDQRGRTRPESAGGSVDIGAVEAGMFSFVQDGTAQPIVTGTTTDIGLRVAVREDGAPLAGVPITFVVPPGGLVDFSGASSVSVLTNSAGIATAPALTAGAQPGTVTAMARFGSLTVSVDLVVRFPDLSITDVTVNEGAGVATFTIALDAASGNVVTVNATTNPGTATAGLDYTTTTQMVTFNPGETTKAFQVPINEDALDEADESFTVILSNATNANIAMATATGIIVDNDAPLVTAHPVNAIIAAGQTATFIAAASGEPTPTVQWQENSGSGFVNITDGTEGDVTYAGATTDTLSVTPSSSAATGRSYRAVFTNTGPSATSNAATITVAASSATISGNTLTITDGDATTQANQYSIVRTPVGALQISDNTGATIATSIAGATGSGTSTVVIPAGTIAIINVNGGAGNDSLDVDYSGGALPTINYDGGSQTGTPGDSLTLTGGTFATGTFAFTNNNDGTITLTGTGPISYTGLEPIVTTGTTINDLILIFNGGAETIELTDADGSNMTIDSTAGESLTFANPSRSLTINAGSGDDIVTITSVDAAYNAALTINGDGGSDTVNLNADITFAADNSLDVDLSNDAAVGDADQINVGTNANLLLSGSGAATLKTSRNIALSSGSSIVTVDGEITLTANQGTATSGDFAGIRVNGATISSASGNISLTGRGGDSAGNAGIIVDNGGSVGNGSSGRVTIIGTAGSGAGQLNNGVVVDAATITAGSGGSVQVTGFGGTSGTSTYNLGVYVTIGGLITSTNGNVTVEGTGGGTASSARNTGVYSDGGTISAGGLGNVTVRGIGGPNGTDDNNGVYIGGGAITSSGGNVSVRGTGGATSGGLSMGVYVHGMGTITAGGSGSLTILGTGGSSGSDNSGVFVENGGTITTGGGLLDITGRAGNGANSFGINTSNATGSITTATNGGNIAFIADSMNLGSSVTIDAGVQNVSLRPFTNDTAIDLGSGSDPIGGPLGLSAAELDLITAGTIQIGDANSGAITVSAAISVLANATITTGDDLTINSGVTLSSGGNVIFNVGDNVNIPSGAIVAANDTITINVDQATDPDAGTGSTVTIVGELNALGGAIVNGGDDADTFIVSPQANATEITVNGGAPTTVPGDTLDVRFMGTTSPSLTITSGPPYSGTWSFASHAPINFANFETVSPTATVSASVPSAAEPSTNGEFTFSRTGDTSLPLVVNYTISGTAMNGTDYTTLTGTVTIAAGDSTVMVPVSVTNDLTLEGSETVIATIATGTDYVIGTAPNNTAMVTIADDDSATVSIVTTTTAAEAATNGSFTVNLTAPSSTDTVVSYSVSGTAVANSDYTSLSGTVTIPAGATSVTINVPVLDDGIVESTETVIVTLTGVTAGDPQITLDPDAADLTATVNINDDDAATVSIATTTNASEPATNGSFTVNLTAPSSTATMVSYSVSGTAVADSDYTALSGTVTIPAGATSAVIDVSVLDDMLDEIANETVIVTLQAVIAGDPQITLDPDATDLTATVNIADDDAAPSLSIDDATVTEGDTGIVTATFTVSLSAASGQSVTVQVSTADNTATISDADYVDQVQTITFAPGETTQAFLVVVNAESKNEADEIFFANLANASNATINDGQGIGTIVNDDPVPELSIADVTINEGAGTATFTVSLSAASGQTVTVNAATSPGSAVAGADFTITAATLTFAPGETTKTVPVPINDDTLDEANEVFSVNLSGATNATIATGTATGTITDNDAAPSLSINDVSVNEDAGTATFTLTLDAVSGQTVIVGFATSDATALAGEDYTSTNGTLIFAPGETTQTITVSITDDTIDEPIQTFTVELAPPTLVNATIADGSGVGSITDDDPAATVSVNDMTVTEGGNLVFTVTLSAASQLPVSVTISTQDGSAVQPGDYTQTTTQLNFAPGVVSQTFSVATNDDTSDELAKTMSVVLSNGNNVTIADGTGVGTINDNDPTPTLSIADLTVSENAGMATFTVTLSAASGQTVLVQASANSGSATTGTDFSQTTANLTFAPGETTKTVNVPITNDALDEVDEAFTVTLNHNSNADIADGSATGTITDNDPTPTLSINDVAGNEGGSVTFTVTLSAVSGRTVTVNFTTTDGTALSTEDYVTAVGSLTFAPGETTKTITANILDDIIDEPVQTFSIVLFSASNATIADNTGVGSITDNDITPTVSVNDVTVIEGGNLVFTVTLSAISQLTVSVTINTVDGTAVQPNDYTAAVALLTFAPGVVTQTFSVATTNDTLDEGEVLTVVLSGAKNATITDDTGTGTISNDGDGPPRLTIPQTMPPLEKFVVVGETFSVNQGVFVVVGETFSFNLGVADNQVNPPVTVTVDFGDGSPAQVFQTTTGAIPLQRTYEDGSFLFTVTANDGQGGVDVEQFFVHALFAPGSPETRGFADQIAPGETAVVDAPGITATVTRDANSTGFAALILAVVSPEIAQNLDGTPEENVVTTAFDVRSINLGQGAVATVRFSYDGPVGVRPTLTYFDPVTRTQKPVVSRQILIDTQKRTITVIFDSQSNPTLQELGGTVFTISVPIEVPTVTGLIATRNSGLNLSQSAQGEASRQTAGSPAAVVVQSAAKGEQFGFPPSISGGGDELLVVGPDGEPLRELPNAPGTLFTLPSVTLAPSNIEPPTKPLDDLPVVPPTVEATPEQNAEPMEQVPEEISNATSLGTPAAKPQSKLPTPQEGGESADLLAESQFDADDLAAIETCEGPSWMGLLAIAALGARLVGERKRAA